MGETRVDLQHLLERDLERVLEDLSDDFPLLRSLVDRRAGGQKRLPLPGRGDERVPGPLFANLPAGQGGIPTGDETAGGQEGSTTPGEPTPPTETEAPPVPPPASPPSGALPPRNDQHPDEWGGDRTTEAPTTIGTLSTVSGRAPPGAVWPAGAV